MSNVKLDTIAGAIFEIGTSTLHLLAYLELEQEPLSQYIQQTDEACSQLATIKAKAREMHKNPDIDIQVSEELCQKLFAELQKVARELYEITKALTQSGFPLSHSANIKRAANNLKGILKRSLLVE